MNDELISRSAVIKIIDELGYINCYDGKDYAANSRVDKIRQKIVEMSASYDVDKVIKKIREIPHGAILNVELEEEIVEIVKSGGVQNDKV